MSKKKITVTLSYPWWSGDKEMYKVEKVTNSLKPIPGQMLGEAEIKLMLEFDNVTVVTQTARGR